MIYPILSTILLAWLGYKVIANSNLGYTGYFQPAVIALILVVVDIIAVWMAWGFHRSL